MRTICHNIAHINLAASTPIVSLVFGMGKINLEDDVLSIQMNIDISYNMVVFPTALRKRFMLYTLCKCFVINWRAIFSKVFFETLISFR